MNLTQLSYELLQEAITKGTITVNSKVYILTASQIITITKFLIQSTPPTFKVPEQEENIPEEMLFSDMYKYKVVNPIEPFEIQDNTDT